MLAGANGALIDGTVSDAGLLRALSGFVSSPHTRSAVLTPPEARDGRRALRP